MKLGMEEAIKMMEELGEITIDMSYPEALEYFLWLHEKEAIDFDTDGMEIREYLCYSLFLKALTAEPSLNDLGIEPEDVEEMFDSLKAREEEYNVLH